ncbi:protein AIG2 A [Arabidopsis lyrata subsp. lyrata]|uniref:protein AIG2 A n=1 Tax=Arabidopsis lyrata subsp. lyrata TaxID=81972 RepID=UPI000A29EAA7|nr:protein AIG2 A [Arabidopsis lyrata subsp. lyrata]|eukprot:XP_020888427.1 protein AIG2 A [Arabidopsis lyrata subsp. lyrata]
MTSSDQSPSHNVFVYGSFQEPAVVSLILECSPVIVSAQLHGYHLYRLKGRLHPCISPSENGVINGKIKDGIPCLVPKDGKILEEESGTSKA